jgi:hypothetical protein
MDTTVRALLAVSIADSGQRLKCWIGVLDELALAEVIASKLGERGQIGGYQIHAITLELALSVAQAYAKAFNRLIEFAILIEMPGIQPQLNAVARYRDIISDPTGMFRQMCEEKQAAVDAANAELH